MHVHAGVRKQGAHTKKPSHSACKEREVCSLQQQLADELSKRQAVTWQRGVCWSPSKEHAFLGDVGKCGQQ